jgi:hypothetical protein
MSAYRDHALALAAALEGLDGVQVEPAPPHGSMFHLILHRDAESLNAAALRLAREDGEWTWGRFPASEFPGIAGVELSVGDATLAWTPAEFRRVIGRLLVG